MGWGLKQGYRCFSQLNDSAKDEQEKEEDMENGEEDNKEMLS